MQLVERYRRMHDPETKHTLKKRIGELNRRILDAERVWERFAPWDA
jgi:hypothetical protein